MISWTSESHSRKRSIGSMGICMARRSPGISAAHFGKVKSFAFWSRGSSRTLKHMIQARSRRCDTVRTVLGLAIDALGDLEDADERAVLLDIGHGVLHRAAGLLGPCLSARALLGGVDVEARDAVTLDATNENVCRSNGLVDARASVHAAARTEIVHVIVQRHRLPVCEYEVLLELVLLAAPHVINADGGVVRTPPGRIKNVERVHDHIRAGAASADVQ
eukprot:12557691-Alexandrium_andersonii.AAC.1